MDAEKSEAGVDRRGRYRVYARATEDDELVEVGTYENFDKAVVIADGLVREGYEQARVRDLWANYTTVYHAGP